MVLQPPWAPRGIYDTHTHTALALPCPTHIHTSHCGCWPVVRATGRRRVRPAAGRMATGRPRPLRGDHQGPRQGEEEVGQSFFELMDYKTHMCPFKWEGEADLKYLYDNVYIGGYGIRSDIKAYEWMEEQFDMKIIKVEMVDDYLYHLDCSIFPLTKEKTLVCTELFTPEELAQISQYTEIINISVDDAYNGLTNSVRLGNMILCASNISEMTRLDENYEAEKAKINTLEKICFNECQIFMPRKKF